MRQLCRGRRRRVPQGSRSWTTNGVTCRPTLLEAGQMSAEPRHGLGISLTLYSIFGCLLVRIIESGSTNMQTAAEALFACIAKILMFGHPNSTSGKVFRAISKCLLIHRRADGQGAGHQCHLGIRGGSLGDLCVIVGAVGLPGNYRSGRYHEQELPHLDDRAADQLQAPPELRQALGHPERAR